jgi:hypothetical protein
MCLIGPGAKKGLQKMRRPQSTEGILDLTVDVNAELYQRAENRRLQRQLNEVEDVLGREPLVLRPIDTEHVLCELQKYISGKTKQRYVWRNPTNGDDVGSGFIQKMRVHEKPVCHPLDQMGYSDCFIHYHDDDDDDTSDDCGFTYVFPDSDSSQ